MLNIVSSLHVGSAAAYVLASAQTIVFNILMCFSVMCGAGVLLGYRRGRAATLQALAGLTKQAVVAELALAGRGVRP